MNSETLQVYEVIQQLLLSTSPTTGCLLVCYSNTFAQYQLFNVRTVVSKRDQRIILYAAAMPQAQHPQETATPLAHVHNHHTLHWIM